MAWCPNCRNEYVDGISYCPDCDVDLVEELPEEEIEQESFPAPEDYEFPEDFDPREVLEAIEEERKAPTKLYKRPEDRYADMNSSAWSFLLVGSVGLIAVILALMGILHLPFHDFVLFVMGALFLLFLVISAYSFQNAKKLKAVIATENDLMQKAIDWYHTTGSKSPALSALDPDQSPEQLYFQRSEIIRKILLAQYPQMDQAMLDKLTDDFCEEGFED